MEYLAAGAARAMTAGCPFAAHADRDDLLAWPDGTGDAHLLLVDGEPDGMHAFGNELELPGRWSSAPDLGQTLAICS